MFLYTHASISHSKGTGKPSVETGPTIQTAEPLWSVLCLRFPECISRILRGTSCGWTSLCQIFSPWLCSFTICILSIVCECWERSGVVSRWKCMNGGHCAPTAAISLSPSHSLQRKQPLFRSNAVVTIKPSLHKPILSK